MKPSSILINTSRGSVVDGVALRSALHEGRIAGAVLDVWEGEPDIDVALLERVRIATPHIAGYSLDGKLAGTRMMAEALGQFLGEDPGLSGNPFEVPVESSEIRLVSTGREAIREAVFAAYPIQEDDRLMKKLGMLDSGSRAEEFDRLRKGYPIRREFRNYRVTGKFLDAETNRSLKAIGFKLAHG